MGITAYFVQFTPLLASSLAPAAARGDEARAVFWCSIPAATLSARDTTPKARRLSSPAVRAMGMAAGNSGVFGETPSATRLPAPPS